jgi:hypothetical protein
LDWDRTQYNFLKRAGPDPNPNPFLNLSRGNSDWDWDCGLTKLTGVFQSETSFLSGGVESSNEHLKQNWRQNGTTIMTINLMLEAVGAQEPLNIPHSTQINAVDQHDE